MKFAGILLVFLAASPMANGFLLHIASEFFEFVVSKVFDASWDPIHNMFPKKETEIQRIGKKLDELISKIDTFYEDFKQAIKSVKHHITVELRRSQIQDLQLKIESRFNSTMEFITDIDTLENVTLQEITQDLSNGAEAVEKLAEQFHQKVFGPDTIYLDNVLDAIRGNRHHFTSNTTTPEEVILHKFFLSLLSVEYKAMILQKVNCFIKFRLAMGRFKTETAIYEKRFRKRLRQATERMRNAFLSSNRELFKLDNKKHVRGKTFAEVTRFNQIYFTNEGNFGSCWSVCEDYRKPRNNWKETYTYSQKHCKGTINNCRSEHTNDYHVWIADANDDRRYQYVARRQSYDSFKPGYRFGQMAHVTKSAKIVDFKGWVRGLGHCDICRCQCDEPEDEKSLRTFSLAPLFSDTENNMVITGVKLAVQDNLFVLEITQAPLNPLGQVNGSISTKTTTHSPTDKVFKLLHDKRSVYMGTAKVDIMKFPNFVATGVKFTEKKGALALEVRFTRFNYSTGQLYDANGAENKLTRHNALSKNHINRGNNGNCPIAYRDNAPSSDTRSGLVQFGPSSLFEDVGQRTVPFLDLQEVRSEVAALTGIGLHFRGREKSGGFISPTLITYPMFMGNEGDDAKALEESSEE